MGGQRCSGGKEDKDAGVGVSEEGGKGRKRRGLGVRRDGGGRWERGRDQGSSEE